MIETQIKFILSNSSDKDAVLCIGFILKIYILEKMLVLQNVSKLLFL